MHVGPTSDQLAFLKALVHSLDRPSECQRYQDEIEMEEEEPEVMVHRNININLLCMNFIKSIQLSYMERRERNIEENARMLTQLGLEKVCLNIASLCYYNDHIPLA